MGDYVDIGWLGVWMGGYGFMWWKVLDEVIFEEFGLFQDFYIGVGYGGQYVIVIFSLDMVIVNCMNIDIQGGLCMGGWDYIWVL